MYHQMISTTGLCGLGTVQGQAAIGKPESDFGSNGYGTGESGMDGGHGTFDSAWIAQQGRTAIATIDGLCRAAKIEIEMGRTQGKRLMGVSGERFGIGAE